MSISARLAVFGLGLTINDGESPNLSIGHVHIWLGRCPLFSVLWLGKFDFVVEWIPTPGEFFRWETYRTSEDVCGGSFMGCQWQLLTGTRTAKHL